MNNIFVLCVLGMGAANQSLPAAESPMVQVADAGRGIAAGGCYGPQTGYRSPVAQNAPLGYSTGTCNCPSGQCNGWCRTNCPNGQCDPRYSATGTANCPNGQCAPRLAPYGTVSSPYALVRYSSETQWDCKNGQCVPRRAPLGTASSVYDPYVPANRDLDCRNGQCHPKGNRGGMAGKPHRNPNSSNYDSAPYRTPNDYPTAPQYPVNYSQPRNNPYSARPAYDGNWTNTNRSVLPISNQDLDSPFFN